MSRILNIDTAVQSASICLAEDGIPVEWSINPEQRDGAAWLHPAIQDLLDKRKITLKDLDAVAISSGPGSYTGLRVGMSAAKGISYALNIPLITVNTLKMMAQAGNLGTDGLLCPMIDARRMEVFTAVFDTELNEVMGPSNLILEENSFADLLLKNRMVFFGNGSDKFKGLITHQNAVFNDVETSAKHMTSLSYDKFSKRDFADLAYSEPFYGKEFHSPVK